MALTEGVLLYTVRLVALGPYVDVFSEALARAVVPERQQDVGKGGLALHGPVLTASLALHGFLGGFVA
jgi:hypothetical protein